jgi:hypothetical protein
MFGKVCLYVLIDSRFLYKALCLGLMGSRVKGFLGSEVIYENSLGEFISLDSFDELTESLCLRLNLPIDC